MELLKKLTSTFGPAGQEDKIAEVIMEEVKAYTDEVYRDRLGNVIALKKGNGKGRFMVAAHMDQIGIVVTHIEKEGYLRFANVGGLNPHSLLYHNIIFKNGVIGTIAVEEKKDIKEIKLQNLYIDIGAASLEEAAAQVNIGDYGIFQSNFTVNGSRVSVGALDDRIGCYIMIETLKKIKKSEYDLYFVFTIQEETFQSGATTASYAIEPDCAFVLDVTDTGDTPECNRMAVKMGKGAAIKVMDRGMVCHPKMKNYLEETAKKSNIPYQFEVLEYGSTDGAQIQVSKAGVLTGAISIPSRYIHSAQEMVDMKDVECIIDLLTKALEEYK